MFQNSDPSDPVLSTVYIRFHHFYRKTSEIPNDNHSFWAMAKKKNLWTSLFSHSALDHWKICYTSIAMHLHQDEDCIVRHLQVMYIEGIIFQIGPVSLLESSCGLAMLGWVKASKRITHQGTSKPIWLMPRPMVIPGLKTSWAVVTPTISTLGRLIIPEVIPGAPGTTFQAGTG